MTDETTTPAKVPGAGLTLLILVGTVVFVSGFLAIYGALGVGVPYIGLLYLLYWAAMHHQDFRLYLPSVVGGLIGLGVAWVLAVLPHAMGTTGGLLAYGALGIVLFFYTRGQLKVAANNSTLLFVLVASIPELDTPHNIVDMVKSLLLAAGIMGAVAWLFLFLKNRRAQEA